MSNRSSRDQYRQPASRSPLRRALHDAVTTIGIVAIAACSPDGATAPSGNARGLTAGARDVTPSATEQLLYQQAPITRAFTLVPPVGNEVASDFGVPSGGRWHVTRIVAVAAGDFNGTLNLKVYLESGGFPGTIVVASAAPTVTSSTATLDPCCGTSIFDYSVPVDFTLDPGRYWLSLQGTGFFPQFATTVGTPLLVGSGGVWLGVPGLDDHADIAYSLYGTVETVAEALMGLQTMLDQLGLDFGTLKSFQVKLKGATDALDAGDTASACELLQDLINAVGAQSGKKLTASQANALVTEVRRIRGLIGC